MFRKKRDYSFQLILFFILVFSINLSAQSAHQSTLHEKIYKEWSVSYHARSVQSSERWDRMTQKGCGHCHSAEGYQHEILEGKESAAPYENSEGLTCKACHSDEGKRGALRAESKKQACKGCHDELVSNTADYLSWCSQGALVSGERAEEFPGKYYDGGAHSRLMKNCISCHMADPADGVDGNWVGGHTFRVISKGTEPRVFNHGPCDKCHLGQTLESVKAFQTKIEVLLNELGSLLPQKVVSPDDSSHFEPRYPADPLLSHTQAKAAYNYHMIKKDGTLGVHNPKYIRQLLEDSIFILKQDK